MSTTTSTERVRGARLRLASEVEARFTCRGKVVGTSRSTDEVHLDTQAREIAQRLGEPVTIERWEAVMLIGPDPVTDV